VSYEKRVRIYPCAYCGKSRADNWDHVVPRSVQKKHPQMPVDLTFLAPACFDCNILKGNRRLVPPSWADKVDALNDYFGGVEWRVWDGNPQSEAYAKAWTK